MRGVQGGGGAAEFGVTEVDHGGRALPYDGGRVGDRTCGLVGGDVHPQGTDQLALERGGSGCSSMLSPISATRGSARTRSLGVQRC
jgi:hypothetical protein